MESPPIRIFFCYLKCIKSENLRRNKRYDPGVNYEKNFFRRLVIHVRSYGSKNIEDTDTGLVRLSFLTQFCDPMYAHTSLVERAFPN